MMIQVKAAEAIKNAVASKRQSEIREDNSDVFPKLAVVMETRISTMQAVPNLRAITSEKSVIQPFNVSATRVINAFRDITMKTGTKSVGN
jgi:hypothetical protein